MTAPVCAADGCDRPATVSLRTTGVSRERWRPGRLFCDEHGSEMQERLLFRYPQLRVTLSPVGPTGEVEAF